MDPLFVQCYPLPTKDETSEIKDECTEFIMPAFLYALFPATVNLFRSFKKTINGYIQGKRLISTLE